MSIASLIKNDHWERALYLLLFRLKLYKALPVDDGETDNTRILQTRVDGGVDTVLKGGTYLVKSLPTPRPIHEIVINGDRGR